MNPAPTQKPLGSHEHLLPKAETAGRQLIHSWITYGPKQLNHFEPAAFPTGPLQDAAGGVLQAMLHEGVKDLAGLVAYFADAPDGTRAELIACTQDFAPMPSDCGPLMEKLRSYDRALRLEKLSHRLQHALASGESTAEIIRELGEAEARGNQSTNLAAQLSARAFDFDQHPLKPVPIFQLSGMPLATAGNLTNVQGPAKGGKSAVMESMQAAVFNGNRQGPDTLGFSAENPKGFALVHFDTEQSRFDHDQLVRRACRRAQVEKPPAWFSSYSVADLDIRDRRLALRHTMHEARETHGGIFAVMIDGIGDLCGDPNDSEESFSLVHELHALAITYDCTIITVLHENPGSESGKTRGHLGSQLERKAETNLRLAKDSAGITTLWADRARHCYLPKEQGPCFSWNDQAGMHTSCGTAGEIKSAACREKMQAEAEAAFNDADSFRHGDLVQTIMDALDLKEKSAKERIRKWNAEGIIRKDSSGKYQLTEP